MKAFALAALLIASQAGAFELKGVALGQAATREQLAAAFDATCVGKSCVGHTLIAGAPADVVVTLGSDGQVDAIFASFDPMRFEGVRDALLQKWGKPRAGHAERVTTAYGATLRDRIVEWKDASGELTVTEFVQANLSGLQLQSVRAIAAEAAATQQARNQL